MARYFLSGIAALTIALGSSWVQAAPCDYYAAPDALGVALGGPPGVAGDPGSESQPFIVSDFWDRGFSTPGATLCLMDGIYRGNDSMLEPPRDTHGQAGNPITIRAQHDGGAFIDGEDARVPVRLRDCNHWVLEGFNAGNGSSTVMGISGSTGTPEIRSNNIVVRRVVAWDALISNGASNNFHVWDISLVDDIVLEDVAGFGTGRKIFQIYRSRRVTLRRAFARWEGSGGGSSIPISCNYRSYEVLCENNIALWSAELQPAINVTGSGRGALAMDWLAAGDETWAADGDPNFDPKNADMRMFGNISIVPDALPDNPGVLPAAPLVPSGSTWLAYIKGVEFVNNLAIADRDDMRVWRILGCQNNVPAGAFCDWAIGLDETEAPLIARHNTAFGGNGINTFSGWTVNEDSYIVQFGSPAPNVFEGSLGAQVCHRYVDGELRDGTGTTNAEPLWPWPMNARILDATTSAVGHSPEDVTQRIVDLVGAIPPACRVAAVPSFGTAGLAVLSGALAILASFFAVPLRRLREN